MIDALLLARTQFAFTISFHMLFPALTIGLASFLVVLEACWLYTKKTLYRDIYHFWLKIFAVNFAMGVVSGIVISYQFGTNWQDFVKFSGAITGPLLTYEVLTAFFLEAGFLGVMLFGWKKVNGLTHFLATVMVAIGTSISTFWILAANSWMQTPHGYEIVNGELLPKSWWDIIFNPSFLHRVIHMLLASWLSAAGVVAAAGAIHLLKNSHNQAARKTLSLALWVIALVAPTQIIIGDFLGLNTLQHQPAKIAAIEAHWENKPDDLSVPLTLFGWPDMAAEKTYFALKIPHLGSLILTHSWDKSIPALKDFAPADRPNATIVFWTFRIMFGLGLLILTMGFISLVLRYRQRLFCCKWFLHWVKWMWPAALIATLTGWMTSEIGRQPWIIYQLLRTESAFSAHASSQLWFTLILFIFVYTFIFGIGIFYIIKMIQQGPTANLVEPLSGGPGEYRTPARPLSGINETIEENGAHGNNKDT